MYFKLPHAQRGFELHRLPDTWVFSVNTGGPSYPRFHIRGPNQPLIKSSIFSIANGRFPTVDRESKEYFFAFPTAENRVFSPQLVEPADGEDGQQSKVIDGVWTRVGIQ